MSDERLNLDDVELEIACDWCHGNSRYKQEGTGRPLMCGKCDGAGFVPTAFGEKVLTLLRHNFRTLLEQEQIVRDGQ